MEMSIYQDPFNKVMFPLLYVPFGLFEFERIYLCEAPYKATKAIKALYVHGYITAMK